MIQQQTKSTINTKHFDHNILLAAIGTFSMFCPLNIEFTCFVKITPLIRNVFKIQKKINFSLFCWTILGVIIMDFLLGGLYSFFMTRFQIKGGRSVRRRDIFDVSGKRYK